MARLTMNQAILAGLRAEFVANPKVFCIGQDIGMMGGAMQSFEGMWKDFKDTGRIIDTPISEEAMVAAGVGAAICGMRPIVEVMFTEFLMLTLAPLTDSGYIYYKTNGQLKVPMVIRTKFGIGIYPGHASDFHSMLVSAPGIKVVMPSNPLDAKGLMQAAIRDDNPVVFFEHMGLLHARRAEVPDDDYVVPLGVADVKRPGTDVTIVATALMVQRSLKVAEQLEKEHNIKAEVVDPRTICPLDKATILSSVKKTGRLVVVHESWKVGGSGGEIAAIVAEEGFSDLKAPIVRVAAPNIPVPFSPELIVHHSPNEQKIMEGVLKTFN